MSMWMQRFHQLLRTENALLETELDSEVGVLELVKSQVCDNVALYAQKYDEDFKVNLYSTTLRVLIYTGSTYNLNLSSRYLILVP